MNELKEFPKSLSFKKLLGPSFILLALGLGSGEIILWPYLTANYGLGIVWAALLGIGFQFFINMEIERYALVKGESVFVGLRRIFPKITWWFIISTFIGFGLPGIIAAAAQVLAHVFGFTDFRLLATCLLIAMGIFLSFGRTVYDSLEKLVKILIFIGAPLILLLVIFLVDKQNLVEFAKGLVGIGSDYSFLPATIPLAVFLGAFAYSGAGGNLNLTQSIYVKEKGYGMGKYSQKIGGLFRDFGKAYKIKITGENFEINPENIKRFNSWWRKINLEHFLIFFLSGFVIMSLLMLLSFSTVFGLPFNIQGINFLLSEGSAIGALFNPLVGSGFLLLIGIMLCQTQLGILDSTSRIMAENYVLRSLKKVDAEHIVRLPKFYFIFLWSQIAFGCLLFAFNIYEPKFLIVLGASINAVTMFVHIFLVNFLNQRVLAKEFRPKLWRFIPLTLAFFAFGYFCFRVLSDIMIK